MSTWQDELWKGNSAGLEAYGDATSGMGKVAAGWYGPEAAALAKSAMPLVNLPIPEHVDIGNLDKQWVSTSDIEAGNWQHDVKQDVSGLLKDPADRLKLLNGLTQNDQYDPYSSGRCGSSVILAAAIQGGGKEGLQALMNQVKKGIDPTDQMYGSYMKSLEKNMREGKLTMGDMDKLNGMLYTQLRDAQNKKFEGEEIPPEGLDPEVLKEFIGKNKTLKGYFQKGDMSIESVDSDGKDGANHFVLQMGGKDSSFTYDPYARKDGNQLVFDAVENKNYNQAETHADQIDGSDFGGTAFKGMYD